MGEEGEREKEDKRRNDDRGFTKGEGGGAWQE